MAGVRKWSIVLFLFKISIKNNIFFSGDVSINSYPDCPFYLRTYNASVQHTVEQSQSVEQSILLQRIWLIRPKGKLRRYRRWRHDWNIQVRTVQQIVRVQYMPSGGGASFRRKISPRAYTKLPQSGYENVTQSGSLRQPCMYVWLRSFMEEVWMNQSIINNQNQNNY